MCSGGGKGKLFKEAIAGKKKSYVCKFRFDRNLQTLNRTLLEASLSLALILPLEEWMCYQVLFPKSARADATHSDRVSSRALFFVWPSSK
jgi:hypothetical protein